MYFELAFFDAILKTYADIPLQTVNLTLHVDLTFLSVVVYGSIKKRILLRAFFSVTWKKETGQAFFEEEGEVSPC